MKHIQAGVLVGLGVFLIALATIMLISLLAWLVGMPSALVVVGLAVAATITATVIDYKTEKRK